MPEPRAQQKRLLGALRKIETYLSLLRREQVREGNGALRIVGVGMAVRMHSTARAIQLLLDERLVGEASALARLFAEAGIICRWITMPKGAAEREHRAQRYLAQGVLLTDQQLQITGAAHSFKLAPDTAENHARVLDALLARWGKKLKSHLLPSLLDMAREEPQGSLKLHNYLFRDLSMFTHSDPRAILMAGTGEEVVGTEPALVACLYGGIRIVMGCGVMLDREDHSLLEQLADIGSDLS